VGTASPHRAASAAPTSCREAYLARVDARRPGEVAGGQAVLGEEVRDGGTEGGVAVDQGVVEVQQQQRHKTE
jgi:hypothetical protein